MSIVSLLTVLSLLICISISSNHVEKYKCLLINARSLRNKLNYFSALLDSINPCIVAVSESWLDPSIPDSMLDVFNKFHITRNDRPSRGGGSLLMISNSFRCHDIPSNVVIPGVELVCVDVFNKTDKIRVIVLYRSTLLKTKTYVNSNQILIDRLKQLCNINYSLILLGDFNLPSLIWSPDVAVNTHILDPLHTSFSEFFISSGLSQLVTTPTRLNSVLDLVLTNDPFLISNVDSLPPLGASDHSIVTFDINWLAPSPPPASSPSRNYSKCNYIAMNYELSQIDWNLVFLNCTLVDDYWTIFIRCIDILLDRFCPTFDPSSRTGPRNQFHYPVDVRRCLCAKKKAWRLLRNNSTDVILTNNYKLACSAYTLAVSSFHESNESAILNSKGSAQYHSFIRRKLCRSPTIPPLLDPSGTTFLTDLDKANSFNRFFSSVYVSDNGILPPFPSRLNSDITINHISFSPSTIYNKLRLLKKSSFPNLDTFPSIVIQSCAFQFSVPLSIIFSNIFEHFVLPRAWLTSIVIPLFKKGHRNLASNYRPISITSSCCKIMESIIRDALSNFLLANKLLSDSQHGFIKNRSTLSNLLSSIRHWISPLDSRLSTDIIYFDFAKAFDSVSHPKLLHKLKSYGISGKLFSFISSWLSGRSQSVKIGLSFSSFLHVLSGVLQGSVLGPLLFLIFINDLIDIIPPEVFPTLFADDLKIFCNQLVHAHLDFPSYSFSASLQTAIDLVFSWSITCSLAYLSRTARFYLFLI